MAKKKYEETNIQAIATAIREKTGTETTYKVADMASGVDEVYEAGKQAEHDAFWKYQDLDNNYKMAFAGRVWAASNFYPSRRIYVNNANSMFQEFGARAGVDLNLSQRLKDCGVDIDFSGCTDYGDADTTFYSAYISHIPKCDFSNMRSRLNNTFSSSRIVEIEELVVSPTYQDFQTPFNNATALTTIKISGTIFKSISFSYSPLTVESMKSIITHLKDYSGTDKEGTYKVTFSSACLTALEAEGATSPNGNTWTEYMTDLGWLFS